MNTLLTMGSGLLALAMQTNTNYLPPNPTMGTSGWTFMIAAWAFVLILVAGCFTKVIWGGKPS